MSNREKFWPVYEQAYESKHTLKLNGEEGLPISVEYTLKALEKAMKDKSGQVKRSLRVMKRILETAGSPYGLECSISEPEKLHERLVIESGSPYPFILGSRQKTELRPSARIEMDFYPKKISIAVKTPDFDLYHRHYSTGKINEMFDRMQFTQRADVAGTLLKVIYTQAFESNKRNR